MGALTDSTTRVIVQGITGTAAAHHTASMLAYGTSIVAGVRPGGAGQEVRPPGGRGHILALQKRRGAGGARRAAPGGGPALGVAGSVRRFS